MRSIGGKVCLSCLCRNRSSGMRKRRSSLEVRLSAKRSRLAVEPSGCCAPTASTPRIWPYGMHHDEACDWWASVKTSKVGAAGKPVSRKSLASEGRTPCLPLGCFPFEPGVARRVLDSVPATCGKYAARIVFPQVVNCGASGPEEGAKSLEEKRRGPSPRVCKLPASKSFSGSGAKISRDGTPASRGQDSAAQSTYGPTAHP